MPEEVGSAVLMLFCVVLKLKVKRESEIDRMYAEEKRCP